MAFPVVEQIAADAEVLSNLADGLAGGEEFECLSFELGGVALSWLGFHLSVISPWRWSRNLAHLRNVFSDLCYISPHRDLNHLEGD